MGSVMSLQLVEGFVPVVGDLLSINNESSAYRVRYTDTSRRVERLQTLVVMFTNNEAARLRQLMLAGLVEAMMEMSFGGNKATIVHFGAPIPAGTFQVEIMRDGRVIPMRSNPRVTR